MKLVKAAMAGTMENSDVMVTVEPADDLTIDLESNVAKKFGASIKVTTLEVAKKLSVTGAAIKLVDHGALDFTIRARLETALKRALKEEAQ
jgi:citrate lyase subunit gamma (acyl carrier protein)